MPAAYGEQIFARFTQQQMDVFRHHDVTDNVKLIPPVHLLQHILKKIPQHGSIEIRKPVITTKRDKMHVPFHLAPL